MGILTKRVLAATLAGALMLPALSSAQADHRRGWNNGGVHYHQHHHRHVHKHRKHRRYNNNVGVAVAAGVIGLAAGAILLGSQNRREYIRPPVQHYRPPVNHYRPAPAPGPVYHNVRFEPWTPAWYRYCSQKFRSFEPQSGTYMTYRGVRKFCQ
ncbi:conserved hypothetical protein [Roseibium sp. TrichSKD4]|uniref:BA14K family protein n=1 Tax=Roseibium sp. TrichSKD4 TaxID=744980 RepID=UPI0001E5698B|nr:BA14K family protein [Roseibium sp. TrichSKD4]EFO31075.1 conserved hypothetical protein [Roseibium sp. TrichSKD4]